MTSFEWTHHMILDQDGMFHILWKPEKDKITFELQVSYVHVIRQQKSKFRFKNWYKALYFNYDISTFLYI